MADYSDLFMNLEAFEDKSTDEVLSMLYGMSEAELVAFVESLNASVPYDSFESKSYFNFRPNSTLSGGPFPCAGSDCRVRNVRALARFAALYADKVLIRNPFENAFDPEGYRLFQIYNLAATIKVAFEIRPLLIAGIIGVVQQQYCLCRECARRVYEAEESINQYLRQTMEVMAEALSDDLDCYYRYDGCGYYSIEMNPMPAYGIDHYTSIEAVSVDAATERLLRNNPKSKIALPLATANQIGIDHYIAPVLDEVFRSQMEGLINGGTFLTNRTADLYLLANAPSDCVSETKCINLPSIEFPMLDNTPVDELLHLREKHHDSFQVFRDAISGALSEYDVIDNGTAQEIRRDVIDPGIHRINCIITNARDDIKQRLLFDAAATSIALGVGAVTNSLTPQLLAGLSALGVTGAALDAIREINARRIPLDAKNDSLYFLWQATRKRK